VGRKRHGKGLLLYPNGAKYAGHWWGNRQVHRAISSPRSSARDALTLTLPAYPTLSAVRRRSRGRTLRPRADAGNRHGGAGGCAQHGLGVATYRLGGVYRGEWDMGARSGHGCYLFSTTWASETLEEYVGAWAADAFNGCAPAPRRPSRAAHAATRRAPHPRTRAKQV
jgi:hypothetical protein